MSLGRSALILTFVLVIASALGPCFSLAQRLDGSVVCVAAGAFVMGSDAGDADERPQRRVYLDAFEIDKYEVTNVQYWRFLQATGRQPPQHWPGRFVQLVPAQARDWRGAAYPPGAATHPVVGVTWQDAADYCAWVGKRLPTEAEWEKAARGPSTNFAQHPEQSERTGDGRTFPWGDEWDPARANTREAGVGYTRPVGSYPGGVSPYGALDMAGNAWEWVADWYDNAYYRYAPDRNPPGPPPGTGERILRGGAWDSSPDQSRTSYRNATHFFGPNFRVGFRCAMDPSPRCASLKTP